MKIKPNKPILLSLCDMSGIMVEPWKESHYCVTLDIANKVNKETDYGLSLSADVIEWKYPIEWNKPDIVFAFPSCTHVATSGAKHFQSKGLRALIYSLLVLEACVQHCETATNFALLENPVSTFSTYWRNPDFKFHPWQYAGYLDKPKDESYSKLTCLWSFGNFKMPIIKPCWDINKKYIQNMQPSLDKTKGTNRSLTPKGFARAVYLSNKGA